MVAMSRGSGVKPQDCSLTESRSQSPDDSQMGSQTFVKGSGNGSKMQHKVGDGLGGGLAAPVMQNSGVQGKPATSGSSREQSDDDDLEGEMEITENMDPSDVKRMSRMLSNRESARCYRRRKQALEAQVSQLRVENSSLLKRLTDINQKYNDNVVNNRILKADVETLRAKVKMAEDCVKRETGANPMFSMFRTVSDAASTNMFAGSPSEASSGDPNYYFHAPAQGQRMTSQPPPVRGAVAGGEMGGAASVNRVDNLEHFQKSISGRSVPSGSVQWNASARWDPNTSINKK